MDLKLYSLRIFLISPHPLTNFEKKQKYYPNEPRFNGVYSRDNFAKTIKYGAYVTNLHKFADVGTHSIALYNYNNEIIYFDSFVVKHVLEETGKYIGPKNKHI